MESRASASSSLANLMVMERTLAPMGIKYSPEVAIFLIQGFGSQLLYMVLTCF